jgi:putative spermidine/putrescine transport system ATP-binding protein
MTTELITRQPTPGAPLGPTAPASTYDGPELVLHSVTKAFGNATAVNGVSFSLERGTFLTMLGPSGSGKSTTLNMIAGFLEPTEGTIWVRGQDVTRLPVHKRGIGMVFQNYSLFPHLSVLRNVAFPLEVRGMKRAEAAKKARAALEIVDLAERAKSMPKDLSGGQQQRVALARAVVFEPTLLLMDEPFGALDKRLREEMQVSIKRITHRLGATVVFVTHDQEEALVMSDQIAIYNRGAVEQFGTAQELYERPRSAFVADFIGESNIIRGTVTADGFQADLPGGTMLWPRPTRPGQAQIPNGSAAALVVRPEQASLRSSYSTADSAPVKGPELAGVVTDVLYLGTSYRFYVHTDMGLDFQVRVRGHLPEGQTGVGDRAWVSWSAADISVVPLSAE